MKKGIKISASVLDNMGNGYSGAFVQFVVPTQSYGGQNQQQGFGTLEELASRGSYPIQYRTFKTEEDAANAQTQNRTFLLYTSAGIPVGQVVVTLNAEEQKDFGIKILNRKVLEHFKGVFGDENVQLIEN